MTSYSEADVSTIGEFQLCNYSAMAALTFTAYDMAITLGQEYKHIWTGPWNNLKTFYLFLRWFPLIAQIVPTVITLKITAGVWPESLMWCRALMAVQALSVQIVMFAVQLILILRVQALYYKYQTFRRTLFVIWVLEILCMTILFAVSAKKIQFGVLCSIVGFPPTVVGYLLMPMAFETFLFGLTMYRFWQTLRAGWGRESVQAQLMKDGIWAFALPFSIFLINYLTMELRPGPLGTFAYSWILAVPSFCGYRLILNMSHLLRPPHRQASSSGQAMSSTYYSDCNLDTIPMSSPLTSTQFTDPATGPRYL